MIKRFANPFAPLQLNGTAADELERLAHMFVQEHIGLYEQFLSENNSRVNRQRWKLVSEQGACRAYGERRCSIDDSSSSSEDDVPIHADTPRSELPTILVTGTVLGELEDAVKASDTCVTCKNSSTQSLNLLDKKRRRTCKIWIHYVCKSYREGRKLCFMMPDHRLVEQEVYFCKPCLSETLSSSAHAIARDEIITFGEVHEWSNTYGSSSGDEPVPLDDLNDH